MRFVLSVPFDRIQTISTLAPVFGRDAEQSAHAFTTQRGSQTSRRYDDPRTNNSAFGSEARARRGSRRFGPAGLGAAVDRHRDRDQDYVAGPGFFQTEALWLPQPPFLDLQVPDHVHSSR